MTPLDVLRFLCSSARTGKSWNVCYLSNFWACKEFFVLIRRVNFLVFLQVSTAPLQAKSITFLIRNGDTFSNVIVCSFNYNVFCLTCYRVNRCQESVGWSRHCGVVGLGPCNTGVWSTYSLCLWFFYDRVRSGRELTGLFIDWMVLSCRLESRSVDSSSDADQEYNGVGNVSFTPLQTDDWNHNTLCNNMRSTKYNIHTNIYLPWISKILN